MPWPPQVREAPRGCQSRVRPAPGPRLPWRLHEPLRPAGGGAGGAAGEERGAGAPLVGPGARWEGLGRRWSPPPRPAQQRPGARRPAPGLHACERLEGPAREPTASASPAQRLGRRSPRSGDNCGVGLLGPAPSLARPPPAAAERVARFVCALGEGAGQAPRARAGGERGRGWRGGDAGGGGGAGSDGPAPPRPHPPAPAWVAGVGGWVRTRRSPDLPKCTRCGGAGRKGGDPRGASNFPDFPLGCWGGRVFHLQFSAGQRGSCSEVSGI